jgi:hypothetical protein
MWGRFSWRLFLAMSQSDPVGQVNTLRNNMWSSFSHGLAPVELWLRVVNKHVGFPLQGIRLKFLNHGAGHS